MQSRNQREGKFIGKIRGRYMRRHVTEETKAPKQNRKQRKAAERFVRAMERGQVLIIDAPQS